MNPAGKVRCNMANQIRLANHNCNFHRLKACVLLPSTSVMTHSVCAMANPGPPQKQPSAGRGADPLICRWCRHKRKGPGLLKVGT
jgi:hypothetical protein